MAFLRTAATKTKRKQWNRIEKMEENFKMIAKTFFGFEEILAKELQALGAQNVEQGVRMVSFKGDKGFMYKANLSLRTALKILKPIYTFRANNENALYKGISGTEHTFSLIMGEDNLKSFHKWKNYEAILAHHEIYVYPRLDSADDATENTLFTNHPKIHLINAPVVEISSTSIREHIKKGKNVLPLLPPKVWEYIDHNNFYKK